MSERINAMRIIADWSEEYGWKAYYNQKNNSGFPVFHSKGSGSKPDILISKGNYNVMIEVKPGRDHIDILNGVDQTLQYAGEYYSGRVTYRTNIVKTIDAFVLATGYSKFGYLCSLEGDSDNINYHGYLKNEFNMTERPITFSATRFLWRSWHKGLAEKYYANRRTGGSDSIRPPRKPSVGVMVSKILASTGNNTKEPYLYLNTNKFCCIAYNEIYGLKR